MSYNITSLPSGLRVASEFLPGVESVAVAVSVGVGSRYENEAEGGLSHLLEHMAFKGTKTRSARDIAESFDAIGGQFNAYTSAEHTVYHAKVLKNSLSVAVDILADILQHSVFDAEELRREQGVILQEIAAHHDTPDDLIFDLFDAVAFPAQPLGRSILGTPELVAGYSRDDVMAYMTAHYTPSRMVLSAAGNVSHEHFVSLAEQYFAGFSGHGGRLAPPAGTYGGGDSRTEDDLEQLHLVMGFPGLSVHDDDYYAMQLYSGILGGGMSSRLFQEIREKRGMAYHVSSAAQMYADCGALVIYSATGTEQSAQLPLLLADELKGMETVSDAEMRRVKNQQVAELLMARESPGTVAGWIGKHLLIFGRYRESSEIIGRIEATSHEDIRRMAERVISGAPTLAALGPVGALPPVDAIKTRLKAA